ncbi:hypothetical protein DSECCO2_554340 [anaerobic digester metagenome]
MLASLKNNRSLTFYQQTMSRRDGMNGSYAGGISAIPISDKAFKAIAITNRYNNEYNGYVTKLNSLRTSDAMRYDLSVPNNAARNMGVKRSLLWDKADIKMGGNGSANWKPEEKTQILENGFVRGAEGHHLQNVADHPEQQVNPDNIKHYRTRKEHLQDGHNGKWQNESTRPLIDKNKMLQKTNSKRVINNELRGLGLAAAIASGVGFALGFITNLAQSGISLDSLKYATVEGFKTGVESGAMSAVSFALVRTLGKVASEAASGLLKTASVTAAEKMSSMIQMGVGGALTIAVFSIYQYIKLKRSGITTKDALMKTGKQALCSLSLLAVSIAAQIFIGGPAGLIVSISIGIIMLAYNVIETVEQRELADKIRIFTIKHCYPTFLV